MSHSITFASKPARHQLGDHPNYNRQLTARKHLRVLVEHHREDLAEMPLQAAQDRTRRNVPYEDRLVPSAARKLGIVMCAARQIMPL